MPVSGDPRLWLDSFSPGLIPQIIQLVLTSWDAFEKPGRSEKEVPITRRFRSFLKRRKNALRELPVRIDRESVEDDPNTGNERGRIDIRFTEGYSCREEVYFAFECKRLNVPTKTGCRSLAREYVTQGMMRFVTAQYAAGLEHGGMIGYVLDGNVGKAVAAVDHSISTAGRKLKMRAPLRLRESLLIPGRRDVRETSHHLSDRMFRIQHVFLRVS
ncbi:MAG: hypothetical protein ACHQ9S_00640 [Candidatus Binatia bacterium]